MNTVLIERSLSPQARLQIVQGDITLEAVDAIVNAANKFLQHGGGVAGVIARRGGPLIQAESDAWVRKHGPISACEPAVTSAGKLPARYVIHVVGPVWGEGGEQEKLQSAVIAALRIADGMKLTSLAIPAISTGIYGYPKEMAAPVILSAIMAYFDQTPGSRLALVRLTLYDQPTVDAFLNAFRGMKNA